MPRRPVHQAILPAVQFMRTAAERDDPLLAWQRPDPAFFASGACHVLAFRFLACHPGGRWTPVYLKPADGLPGTHMYVTDGRWAFDFNGWSSESALLDVTTKECRRRWPGWDAERIVVHQTFDAFCHLWRHRPPSQFAFDPNPRADAYLERFPHLPPGR